MGISFLAENKDGNVIYILIEHLDTFVYENIIKITLSNNRADMNGCDAIVILRIIRMTFLCRQTKSLKKRKKILHGSGSYALWNLIVTSITMLY